MSNSLSNDLIAQFAKATVGGDETKQDTALRGTITRVVASEGDEGVLCVKLDGSDIETPVSRIPSTIADFAEGDRVEVTVKNHAVTITGNTTKPAIGVMTEGNLRSEISQTAKEIRLEVADTANKLESSITLTASEIRSEVANEVEGLNSKITQTSEEISQKISNNEDEFTEFKQTVEGWEFVDENGSIVIKDGAISWDKLASDAQSKVNTAQNTANSASSAAATAQSTANSASSTASTASTNAWSALNSVSNWASPYNSTYIDGTKIFSNSIYADKLHLGGILTVYDGVNSTSVGGYLGYDSGFNSTYGIGIRDSTSTNQVVCTNNAARMSSGSPSYGGYSQVVTSTSSATIETSGTIFMEISNVAVAVIQNHGTYYALRPNTNSTVCLGNTSNVWDAVYATTCTGSTSDRNKKNSIEDLPEKYLTLFDNLKPKRFKLNNGTSGRYHIGYIAQEVEDAMIAAGVDGQEFGGFIRDKDEEGNDIYLLRYGEFDAMRDAKLKQLEARLIALEKGER